MKVGAAMIIAVAALGFISTVSIMTPDNSEEEALAAAENQLETYKYKKMYSEAIASYQQVLQYDKYSNDYNLWNEYHNYALEHGFEDEMVSSAQKLLQLNTLETAPANNVLEWYKDNEFENVYGWLSYLRNVLPVEQNIEFDEYYDTIKGKYSIKDKGFTELGEWALAVFDNENRAKTYLIGTNEDNKRVVIDSNGAILAQKDDVDKIISYSYSEKLLAGINEEQLVYQNIGEDRKRVPFDYQNKALLDNEYLGPYYSGIANFCDKDGVWGFVNSNADIMYNGYKRTTPGNEGIFAAQNENGLWTILQLSNSGLVNIGNTEYDDLKTDEYGYMIKNGVFFGHSGGSWFMNKIVVDDKGNYGIQKLDTAYEDAKVFGDLGAVKLSGKWGFVDYNGEMFIEPTYDDAKSFSCGFAAVKKGEKWGYIDTDEKTVIDFSFKEANAFSKYGIAPVKNNLDEWMLIQLDEYEISEGVYK